MGTIDTVERSVSVRKCVYFPFVSLDESTVRQLSTVFDRVTLYQPVGAKPRQDLQPWIEKGLLKIRTPFEGITDKSLLLNSLQQWKTWIQSMSHQDLAYLKVMKDGASPAQPLTPKVISQIKGMTGEEAELPDDLSCQLFLLLSQEWDEQFSDLNADLKKVRDRYQSLQAFFHGDDFEEEDIRNLRIVDPVLTEIKEDRGAELAEKQLAAWNRLFQKDPETNSVLLTDSPAVFDRLLEDHSETIDVSVSGEATGHDSFDQLLSRLLTHKWDQGQAQRVVTLQEELAPHTAPGSGLSALRLVVIPEVASTTLLNDRLGNSPSSTRPEGSPNTVIGLWHADDGK